MKLRGSNMKKLITITGCTSSGKTLIQDAVVRVNNNISKIVSTTSRPIRINEKESIDYYYISKAKALEMLKLNEFIECRKYDVIDLEGSNTWYYGISKEEVLNNKSDIAITIVDEQGRQSLKQYCKDNDIEFISYYISCSYKTLLQRSISREGNIPNIKVLEMCRRLQSDYEVVEIAKQDKDIILLNNETQQDFINAVIRIAEGGDK
jgi:guanylate kinase